MQPDIRILIVDDHHLVRAGIRHILSETPHMIVVGEAGSGAEAIQAISTLKPDVVLLDLKMPSMDGFETSRALLEINPHLRILIVSASLDESMLPRLLREGVAGYFSKISDAEEMVIAIRAIYAGQCYISPVFARQMSLKAISTNEQSAFDALSERELQVILMLIEGQTLHEIAERLDINIKTISSYRNRSFHKLNIQNNVELTLLALRQGLLANMPDEHIR